MTDIMTNHVHRDILLVKLFQIVCFISGTKIFLSKSRRVPVTSGVSQTNNLGPLLGLLNTVLKCIKFKGFIIC